MKQRIYNYIITSLMLICVIVTTHIVLNSGIRVFHTFLVRNQSLIITRQTVLNLLTRHMLTIILIVFGACCIFMYFISYEVNDYLQCARVSLLGAGVVCTNMDVQILFYSERFVRLMWLKAQSIYLILFATAVYNLLMTHSRIKGIGQLRTVNWCAGLLAMIVMLMLRPAEAITVIWLYLAYCVAIISYTMVRTFYFGERVRGQTALLFFYPVVPLLLWFVVQYKGKVKSWQFSFLANGFPYLMTALTLFLIIAIYRYQRVGLLFGRSENRKYTDFLRNKAALAKTLTQYCSEPIDKLNTLVHVALRETSSSNQEKILRNMENELVMLERHMDNIISHETLPIMSPAKRKIRISLGAVFSFTKKNADRMGIHWKWHLSPAIMDEGISVLGEPYDLIRASQAMVMSFNDLRLNDDLYINCFPDGIFYCVVISMTIDPGKRQRARQLMRMLTRPDGVPSVPDDDGITLQLAHRIIANHGSIPTARLGRDHKLIISYYLPVWSLIDTEEQAQNQDDHAGPEATQLWPLVMMVSASAEQIALVKSYLEFEHYRLRSFTDPDDALRFLENDDTVAVLMVGTLFHRMTDQQFCQAVRQKFTLERMPVLLIRPERFIDIDQTVLEYINDVLVEPFQQTTFLQKLKSLVLLKRSVDASIKVRLDYLQSQMDPHFIFNTIGTIMPLCIQDPPKAYELLGYFSEYLRASLFSRELQEEISLSQEIDLIVTYLEIEKVRFGDRIQYHIQAEGTERCRVLPLMIEPIVENCVKHGIGHDEILHIDVEIEHRDKRLYVSVRDDGKGMSPERVQAIVSEQKSTLKRRSIGLGNVQKRLRLYYHSQLVIESEERRGTRVRFSIPAVEENPELVNGRQIV